MAVRNFYIEADIDGYKTLLKGGPRGKSDGMTVTLYQRNKGEIVTALKIECYEKDGKLYSEIKNVDENNDFVKKTIKTFETEY